MKETKIYVGSVFNVVETLAPGSGALLKKDRQPVIFNAPISAVSQQVADAKLLDLARGKDKDLDLDNLEIVCRPFPY